MTVRSKQFLAAAAMMAASVPAYALDLTPDAARIVSDPLYLPYAGQIFGATSYDFATTSQDGFDSTGARTSTARIDENVIAQQLMYGVNDDLTLRFDWDFDPSRDVSRHIVGGGINARSSSGWTDPDFGITWRAIDQGANPFSLDLRADYSPDAFPAKAPTTVDEGTVARGGQMAGFGLTLGHQARDFTIAGTFDAHYLDTRQALNQNTGDFTRTGPLWDYVLGVMTQTRLDDRLSVNAGVSRTFSNDARVFNASDGLTHFSQGGDSTNLNAALNYHFVPNTVVGSLEYQHNFYDSTQNVFPTAPADNTAIRDKNEDVFGVTLRYVFQ